jgi:stage II sporulation protein D
VEFLVQGNGHRVGLSQYGAQALAQEGKTYVEILQWYYTGVEITEYR